jgi:hypothetical protein
VVKFIKNSPQTKERFERILLSHGQQPKAVLLDVKTRWSSTFLMIERALEFRASLTDLCQLVPNLTKQVMSDEEWDVLREAASFLEIFKEITQEMEGSKVSLI